MEDPQPSLFDGIKAELEDPSAKRAFAILDMAQQYGWNQNPYSSFVVRLTREDARPFFCRWDLYINPDTAKRSWRFAGARASNGQALNYNDIQLYLEDPTVIEPEPPVEDEDAAEAAAIEALKPITQPETVNQLSTDWSILG